MAKRQGFQLGGRNTRHSTKGRESKSRVGKKSEAGPKTKRSKKKCEEGKGGINGDGRRLEFG